MSFIRDLFKAAVVIVGDMVDEIGSGISRGELVDLVRKAQADVAEAQTEQQQLRHEVGELTQQKRELADRLRKLESLGAKLGNDQAIALRIAVMHPQPYSQSEDTDLWVRQEIRQLMEDLGRPMSSVKVPEHLTQPPVKYISGRHVGSLDMRASCPVCDKFLDKCVCVGF